MTFPQCHLCWVISPHLGRLACGAVVTHEGQCPLSSGGVHLAGTILTTATGGRAGGRAGERGREAGREREGGREAEREGGRPGERGREAGRGREGGREMERGREGERRRDEGGRERDISSLSLPADVAATRICLIPTTDMDTTWAPTGLNLHPCQQLG